MMKVGGGRGGSSIERRGAIQLRLLALAARSNSGTGRERPRSMRGVGGGGSGGRGGAISGFIGVPCGGRLRSMRQRHTVCRYSRACWIGVAATTESTTGRDCNVHGQGSAPSAGRGR